MTEPLTTVSYRLQNVDFLSYIELPVGTPYTEMRPLKASNNQQVRVVDRVDSMLSHRLIKWNFVDAGSGTYYIQNAARPNQYLYAVSSRVTGTTQASAFKWKVLFDNGSYMLVNVSAFSTKLLLILFDQNIWWH